MNQAVTVETLLDGLRLYDDVKKADLMTDAILLGEPWGGRNKAQRATGSKCVQRLFFTARLTPNVR